MIQTLKKWLRILFEFFLRIEKTCRSRIVDFYNSLGLDGIVDKIVSKVLLRFGIGSKNSNQIDVYTANETELGNNLVYESNSTSRAVTIFFITLILLIVGAVYWAMVVEIDEVIRANGKIVPASKAKTVQSEFQGSIEAILVEEGEVVKQDQILFKLVDIDFVTEQKMNEEQYFAALAKLERLNFEAKLERPIFSEELRNARPDLVLLQMEIYQARAETLSEEIKLLISEQESLEQQRRELKTQLKNADLEQDLLEVELDLIEPMVQKGFEPKIKIVQLKQRIAAVEAKIEQAEVSMPGIDLQKDRIDQEIRISRQKYVSRAKEEIETARSELAKATMRQDQLSDRVARTEIKAPTDGTISKVEVTTIGEVVSPGVEIVEIIPLSDELVIETELQVQDISAITLNQKARVSFSAYDAGVYGYLDANVQKIGINTEMRDDGSSYYPVRVITNSRKFDRGNEEAQFVPGMTASVEIVGETRTIAQYMLARIEIARRGAFTER